jgi:hypothetical protein
MDFTNRDIEPDIVYAGEADHADYRHYREQESEEAYAAPVIVNGCLYANVEIDYLRSPDDFYMFENISFKGIAVVNGEQWIVARSDTKKPYMAVTLLRILPPDAPLAQSSQRTFVRCQTCDQPAGTYLTINRVNHWYCQEHCAETVKQREEQRKALEALHWD